MFIWHREVESYRIAAFRSSTLATRRQLTLLLKPSDSETVNQVSVTFEPSPPGDFINIGSSFATIRMALGDYEAMYQILQGERPVYFTAYETGTPPVRFAGLSTDPEGTSEGFVDPDA
jgi:hypothetical protein